MSTLSTPFAHFGEFLALLTAITWALAVILFKKSGENVNPLALNYFKNILALTLFIPTSLLMGITIFRPVPAQEYWMLIISGILGIGIGDTLFLKSLNLLGAGLQAIINCLYAPSIIFLSILYLNETMTPWQVIGSVLIISAVLVATTKKGKGNVSNRDLIIGISLGVIASLVSAMSIVMIKTLLERSPVVWVTQVRLTGGIGLLTLILLFHPKRGRILSSLRSPGSWGYTLSGSFMGAYMAMLLWLAGMKYTKASIASVLNQTSNIFVFVFAAWLLREPINLQRMIGIILGVGGAILVTFG